MHTETKEKTLMMTNATETELIEALAKINVKYEGNVEYDHIDRKGKRLSFTLKTKESRKRGSRIGHTGRHFPKACWHVHGDLFDALFKIREDIFIVAGGRKITVEDGNWEDRNIGSYMDPLMYSEACDCASWED